MNRKRSGREEENSPVRTQLKDGLLIFVNMWLYTMRVRILDEVSTIAREKNKWSVAQGACKCPHFRNSESPW